MEMFSLYNVFSKKAVVKRFHKNIPMILLIETSFLRHNHQC